MANQTTTTSLDPQTQSWQTDVYNAARNAAGMAPADPYAQRRAELQAQLQDLPRGHPYDALRRNLEAQLAKLPPPPPPGASNPQAEAQQRAFAQAIQYGLLGQSAYGGEAAALQRLMNPQLEDLIAKSRLGYADAQKGALNTVADRFTKAGAYGGSRQAVASGVATSNLARAQAQNESGMRYQATQDAYGRASQLMNLGMSADDPRLRALLMARGMPYGTSTSQPVNQNRLMSGLGGAISGYETFGPWGGVAGGAAGVLG